MKNNDVINTTVIAALQPCKDRFDNWIKHYKQYEQDDMDFASFLSLDSITYSDKVWVFIRLFTKKQNIQWAIECARSVLHIYEQQYPGDTRPRNAIDIAERYINEEATKEELFAAYHAAISAAYSGAYSAANAANAANAADAAYVEQYQLNLLLALEVANGL